MMKAARYNPGGPENLFVKDDEPIPEPGAKEVRIRVVATAINRADTLQRKGLYNPPPGTTEILGLEAAGTIDKLGTDCSSVWKIGDRVMALLAGGGNAEYVISPVEQLIKVPSEFSLVKAAAVPEVWLTAYQLLYFVGHVKKSDTVLIHAGASGVGTAAVQLVKQLGAKSIVTAGSQEKIDLAVSLGAEAGVNYKEGNMGDKVMALTDGKGVDLILDCVGASMFEDNFKCVAVDGRWVVYGLMGGRQANFDMGQLLRKRVCITATTLRTRSLEYKAKLVKEFSSYTEPFFKSGIFKPIIDRILPFSDIAQAHSIMEGNQNKGKIVLQVVKEAGGHGDEL